MAELDSKRPSLTLALADVWAALKSKLRSEPEYDTIHIKRAEHLQLLAKKFFLRAARLRRIAVVQLISALSLTVVGIAVFLLPTQFADLGEAEQKVKDASNQRDSLREQAAQRIVDYRMAVDSWHLLGIFHELKGLLSSYNAQTKIAGNSYFETAIRYAIDASTQLSDSSPQSRKYSFQTFQYFRREADTAEITAAVFQREAERLSTEAFNLAQLRQVLQDLQDSVGTPGEADAVSDALSVLRMLQPHIERAESEKESLALMLSDEERRQAQTTEQIQAAEKQISDALLELGSSNASGNAFNSWVPMLTVRIGVVVLLLYLTRVLLASYRYTLTLAAYFAARGDAIQLLSHRPSDKLYDVEELKALIPLLSPDVYQIDAVAAPDETVAKIAANSK